MPATRSCALVDPAADLVLVGPDDPPRLPVVGTEWPSPGDLALVVGAPTAWPASPPVRGPDGDVVDVLVARAQDSGDGRRWWPLARAVDLGLDPVVTAGLVTAARELREGPPDDGRADWWRPGWADDVEAWVDDVLELRGARRLGPGEPVKVWSLSAVVRYAVAEADGREVRWWFKAACAGLRAEPAITAWVTAQAPSLVPGLVAHDVARGWLLLEPVEAVEQDPGPELLTACAAAHARAQVATLSSLGGLLAAGAPDRGEAATTAALTQVLLDSKALPWLLERVAELHALGLPPSLVHGDLHLGNVGLVGERPVVFDWTDACVAHPYLDGAHLATSVARTIGPEAAGVVRDAFVGVWAAAWPGVDHARAWDLAHVVDRAFTLLSYDAIGRVLRPQDRVEHAGVAAELRLAVEAMATGSAPP